VAEEFGFNEAFRDGAAGDSDEGVFGTIATIVNGPGTSSLPVPLSPAINTKALRLATRRMRSYTIWARQLEPDLKVGVFNRLRDLNSLELSAA
jgi:hypothetical protein